MLAPRSTFDTKGVSTIKIKTTGHEKLRFTVALTAGVYHENEIFVPFVLPPLVIFKNLTKAPSGKFPPGMVILGTKGGSMKRDIMVKEFISKIWARCPGGYFKTGKSVILLDSHQSHFGKEVDQAFELSNTTTKMIHGGMTPLIQFLDTHINKPFKDCLKEAWETWMEAGVAANNDSPK